MVKRFIQGLAPGVLLCVWVLSETGMVLFVNMADLPVFKWSGLLDYSATCLTVTLTGKTPLVVS